MMKGFGANIVKHRVGFLVLAVFLGWAPGAHGQKEPQYTQYMYNIGSFNPAYVGTVETAEIIGLYRAQWIDIEGAPRTIRAGANLPFKNEVMGLGINVVSDNLGPVSQTYADVSYSYQVNLTDATKLSFGMDAGGSFLNVDFSKGTFENPGEPLNLDRINRFYATIGAGAFLYGDNWYLGASIPNFLTEGVYNDEVASVIEEKIQFNFIGGYVFNLSDDLLFKPAFLINTLSGAALNSNLSANFLISDVVTAGVSYRLDNAISGLAGIQISSGIYVGYSYDYNTNLLGEFNNGSHEIILKFYLGKGGANNNKDKKDKNDKGKTKQIDTPRFF
ncbi:type IX secretion system membrane protein PorP/SprF [Maribacter sp. 2307ULW6-5]|uniref:PorP/SprF family type IX secretion system membrane protein n=1 Tax=Maribacter sp. 2307ULW6-5 TaxID=3386275 RepID=UPI0039BD6830